MVKKIWSVKTNPFKKAKNYTSEKKALKAMKGKPFAQWKVNRL